jgi:hypothetical protein
MHGAGGRGIERSISAVVLVVEARSLLIRLADVRADLD